MANLENVEKDKEDKSYYPEIAALNFSMCFPSAFSGYIILYIYKFFFSFCKIKALALSAEPCKHLCFSFSPQVFSALSLSQMSLCHPVLSHLLLDPSNA